MSQNFVRNKVKIRPKFFCPKFFSPNFFVFNGVNPIFCCKFMIVLLIRLSLFCLEMLHFQLEYSRKKNVLQSFKKIFFFRKLFLNCKYLKRSKSPIWTFAVTVLRELFSSQFLNLLKEIVFSVQMYLGFVHLIHVKSSCYQSFMTSMLILIKIQFFSFFYLGFLSYTLKIHKTAG